MAFRQIKEDDEDSDEEDDDDEEEEEDLNDLWASAAQNILEILQTHESSGIVSPDEDRERLSKKDVKEDINLWADRLLNQTR